MRIRPTAVDGAYVVDPEPHVDDRGSFARTFDADIFAAHGMSPLVVQCSVAHNARAGTVRGLHVQGPSAPEAKLVRCTRGAVLDVAVDLRAGSPTYRRHVAVELTADNRLALYVPELCAHGYQTLTDDAEVTYQVSHAYAPAAEHGVRYDDPSIAIDWPLPVAAISDKDRSWPLLDGGA